MFFLKLIFTQGDDYATNDVFGLEWKPKVWFDMLHIIIVILNSLSFSKIMKLVWELWKSNEKFFLFFLKTWKQMKNVSTSMHLNVSFYYFLFKRNMKESALYKNINEQNGWMYQTKSAFRSYKNKLWRSYKPWKHHTWTEVHKFMKPSCYKYWKQKVHVVYPINQTVSEH